MYAYGLLWALYLGHCVDSLCVVVKGPETVTVQVCTIGDIGDAQRAFEPGKRIEYMYEGIKYVIYWGITCEEV